ncbi:MAG: tRNA (uridine(34)/cytosine(34)/5-carboxymethylaminomethyluridine(34)-2'-O)-methyltransferase TrmL [Gammaproteobacteria bacterium]|nr:tRNA (uridine(34)/cytosine(34)/5-carboxymethylaminomethyluridine(34)-2'-O)-methyltransferase TrmL [Gammaproteobacteria bacterium]
MLHIALFEPEIPPNTGNIIRLCANTGAQLHLIEPLGFRPDDAKMRRAGLDYHEFARVQIHVNFQAFQQAIQSRRLFALSTKASVVYTQPHFQDEDVFLFGPETRGLPASLHEVVLPEHWLRLPMKAESRSLNLSNTVAVVLYEAWRQLQFL